MEKSWSQTVCWMESLHDTWYIYLIILEPEPHILLFKREKDYQIKYPNAGSGGMVC